MCIYFTFYQQSSIYIITFIIHTNTFIRYRLRKKNENFVCSLWMKGWGWRTNDICIGAGGTIFIRLLDGIFVLLQWFQVIKSVLWNFAILPILPFLNNPKDLDPSYKMDLDLLDCFGRKITLSYNRRNMVGGYGNSEIIFIHSSQRNMHI